ncbi:MAG: SMC family ATPase [Parcubacteria group bacterium]
MIPQKLQLYNFLSYGQEVEPLDFRGLELACLTGANGVGKSSLLEAVTWVLWGKSRAASDDDLIRHGHQQMWVDFEFKLGRSLYRVTRKRTLKGRGQSSLDFMVSSGVTTKSAPKKQTTLPDKWRSLAGTSKNETQAIITDTLKMSYETFVNSAFLRQGKADEFTLKKPQERKKVLADILNLAYYDQLVDKAKAKIKELAIRIAGLEQQLEFAQEDIKDKKDLATETKTATEALQKSNTQIKKLEQELTQLNKQKEGQEANLTKAQHLDERLTLYQKDISQLEQDYQEQKNALRDEQNFLSQDKIINANYQKLIDYRQQDEKLNELLARKNELLSQQTSLEQIVSAHQAKDMLARGQLVEKVKFLTTQVNQKETITQNISRLAKQVAQIRQAETSSERLEQKIQTLKTKLAQSKLLLGQITEQGQKIKVRIATLQTTRQADCPLCKQKLTSSHRQKIIADLKLERQQAVQKYQVAQAKIARQQSEIKDLTSQHQDLRKELANKAPFEAELLNLQTQRQKIDQANIEIKALQVKIKLLDQAQPKDSQIKHQEQQLTKIKTELARFEYQTAEHQKIKASIKKLDDYEQQKTKLERVRENIARGQDNLQKIGQAKASKVKEQQKTMAARKKLDFDQGEITGLKNLAQVKQRKLDSLRTDTAGIQAQAGALQEKLTRLKTIAQAVKKQRVELNRLTAEKSQYEELMVAFGKSGIQAMIIETAIPEIEEEANKLLNKMTDGRMQVHFLTQRQKKTGTDVMETLDIIINDEMGVKNYEMFSGGEAYRINFAIRIALSKLLANRAGAKLQFLVIDEGFGTQDNAGRESIIEAINSISDDFAKILVITHIQELKNAFATRIEVVKDQAGSHYEIVG